MTDDVTAAPQDGGQAAPAPATQPAEGAASAPASNWLDGFNDDMKGYIETKGFKDPASLADSYRNLEKLRGVPAESLLQLPSDMSDGEAMGAVYDRLGRPESADAYTNVLGDGFDASAYQGIAAKAHELGLNDAQFKGLQEITALQSQQMQEAMDTQASEAFDQWKSANSDGFNNAAKLMANVGIDEAGLEGLLSGDKASMYDFLAKVASRSAEGQVIQGDPPGGEGFNMSPAAAKQKVSELFADTEFMKQYTSHNQKIRQPAIDRMMKLQEAATRTS